MDACEWFLLTSCSFMTGFVMMDSGAPHTGPSGVSTLYLSLTHTLLTKEKPEPQISLFTDVLSQNLAPVTSACV